MIQLGHYRLIEELGSGGMGQVYLARDTKLNRNVALKILAPELSGKADCLRRFIQEAKAASSIKHPNVAHIYDIGECEGVHFIAMEYVEGKTLASELESGPLPISEVLKVGIQAAGALAEAHQNGIVHRDLKLSNLMRTTRGELKVLDFGVAQIRESRNSSSFGEATTPMRTEPGVILGTISHMSPEQARGETVDALTDIFSLGVVLYELVTGRHPFGGATNLEIIGRILYAEPESIPRAGIPDELVRIILKCLEKPPHGRYQSAGDLVVALERLQRNERPEAPRSLAVRRKRWAYGALVATVTLAVLVFLFSMQSREENLSLAVFPFEHASTDPDSEFLGVGMAETLTVRLSRLRNVKVLSSSSVSGRRYQALDPSKARSVLGVDAVLRGRIQRRGDDLRVTAELVDTRDGTLRWGEQWARTTTDIFDLQDEIVREITTTLSLQLSREDEARLTKGETKDPSAYMAYLRGCFHLSKRTQTGFQQAVERFEEAIKIDPGYALAHVGLADTYNLLGYYVLPPSEAFPKARAAAERALEIEGQLAEAHASRGYTRFVYGWDLPGAEKDFRQAIEINGGYATAHHWYAFLLTVMGRSDEGVREIEKALELDPLSLMVNVNVGQILSNAGRYEQAVEQLQRTIELDENFGLAHAKLGQVYIRLGRYEDAAREFDRYQEVSSIVHAAGDAGFAYVATGRRDRARLLLDRLESESRSHYISSVEIATIYGALGERDEAWKWMEQAYDERDSNLVFYRFHPAAEVLREDPRFSGLLKRMGLEGSLDATR